MKYDHDIIRDLMPLCIDGIASEKSREAVENHIAECPECKAEWEQMKKSINPCENIPLPEDTSKYKETAKRVKKHNRWMLLKVTCAVIAALFVIGIVGNFIDGARFSPEAVAKMQFKEMSADFYETPEEMHKAPGSEITVIGTIKSSDGKVADTFAIINEPDRDVKMFSVSNSSRCDMMRMGLWTGNGGSIGEYGENNGIYMSGFGHSCSYCNKYYGSIAFYVTDNRIKNISFMLYEQSYTLSPDKNGFCGMAYEPTQEQWDSKGYGVHEGTATDENGKVLYEIQQKTKTTPKGSEFTYYDWVNVE